MLASNSICCHPADIVLDNIILLSHAICQSLCRYGLVYNKKDCERDRARVSITSSLVQCHAPGLITITKLKTMKINFEGLFRLSTKITRHTVLWLHMHSLKLEAGMGILRSLVGDQFRLTTFTHYSA